MQIIIAIFALIIVLGVLVFVHEFGHFIAARLSGMRADIFSLGMGKRLLGWNKKTGFSFGSMPEDFQYEGKTDYRLSLFPIGGYVKIVGMIDESMDTQDLSGEPEPWEFRAKPWYLKIFVLIAGVLMNIILAWAIYSVIAAGLGDTRIKITEIGFVEKNTIADVIGLEHGDKILSIGDKQVQTWNDVQDFMMMEAIADDFTVNVLRNSENKTLSMSNKKYLAMLTNKIPMGLAPMGSKIFAAQVNPNSPAEKAGLRLGDTLMTLCGEEIFTRNQLVGIVKANKEKPIKISFKRGGEIINSTVTPNSSGIIGVSLIQAGFDESMVEHIDYTFGEVIMVGWQQTVNAWTVIRVSLSKMFDGSIKAKDSLGGPIMIAQQAGQMFSLGFYDFINFMAILSVSLALLNILPIPALDGGQIVIVIIEAIIRRELPEKAKIIIQQVGLFIILGLMVFVFYNDIARIIQSYLGN